MSSERRALVVGLALILSILTLLLLAGHGPWSGAAVVRVDDTHGLNRGDIPVLGLWACGMVACAVIARRP